MSNEKEIQASILVCDDDKEIAEAISIYLQAEQYTVATVNNGQEAVDLILTRKKNFDLIIMDVMMPVLDGIRTTKKLREFGVKTPIIFLSAKIDTNDKILGLNIGGDDYIEKPFNALELIARVKTVLRRDQGNKKNPLEIDPAFYDKKTNSIVIGDLKIETETRTVTLSGKELTFTPIEYDILLLLSKNPGKVFSIDKIYELVWHATPHGAENIVAVHIRHIREKIEKDPSTPKYLKVVWGSGYKIEKIQNK